MDITWLTAFQFVIIASVVLEGPSDNIFSVSFGPFIKYSSLCFKYYHLTKKLAKPLKRRGTKIYLFVWGAVTSREEGNT